MSKKWRIQQHSTVDKSFEIIPPSNIDIYITVDFDDVDHSTVNKNARAIVDKLNDKILENKSEND